jgi:hypothetical protein
MESVSLRAPAQLHNKMLTGGTLGDAFEIGGACQAFNRDHCNAHGEASGTKRRGGASEAAWHAAHNRRAVFACVWPPFIVERNVESPGRRRNELPELVPARIPYTQTEQSARTKAPSSAGRVREKTQTRARDRAASFLHRSLWSLGRCARSLLSATCLPIIIFVMPDTTSKIRIVCRARPPPPAAHCSRPPTLPLQLSWSPSALVLSGSAPLRNR